MQVCLITEGGTVLRSFPGYLETSSLLETHWQLNHLSPPAPPSLSILLCPPSSFPSFFSSPYPLYCLPLLLFSSFLFIWGRVSHSTGWIWTCYSRVVLNTQLSSCSPGCWDDECVLAHPASLEMELIVPIFSLLDIQNHCMGFYLKAVVSAPFLESTFIFSSLTLQPPIVLAAASETEVMASGAPHKIYWPCP